MGRVDRLIFVSYSRADAARLERLKVHLRPLVQRGCLELWDDSRIVPGQPWREEITNALARAGVAILLISADFLASDFITNNELPPLLHRASTGGLLILPLILSPCLFDEHEDLSRYQCVNSPDQPLSAMSLTDAEACLVSLSRSVARYFRLLESAPTGPKEPLKAITTPVGASLPSATRGTVERPGEINSTNRVSPSGYRTLAVDRPINLGFDGAVVDGIPVGWFNSFGHVAGVSTEYRIRVAKRSEDRTTGTCAVLERTAPVRREFGSLMQRCPGGFVAGRTVRFEGELRTEDVSEWAGLWFRADARRRANIFFDNMSRRPVVGTTPWTRYFIDAMLPGDTDWLNYGIVLSGPGKLYVDNLRLLIWTADGRWEDV